MSHSDRFGPSRDSKRYRFRKKNGLAWVGVECRDDAIRDLSDFYGIPKEEIIAWLVEATAASEEVREHKEKAQVRLWWNEAIHHAIENPVSTISEIQDDGSVIMTWADGDKFHFTAEAWANWRSGGAGVGGWMGPDNTLKIDTV